MEFEDCEPDCCDGCGGESSTDGSAFVRDASAVILSVRKIMFYFLDFPWSNPSRIV